MAQKPRHYMVHLGYYVTVYICVCIILLALSHHHMNELQLKTHHFATNNTLPSLKLQHPARFITNYTLASEEQYGQFNEFLSLWPSDKPKAGIYFLIEDGRLTMLRKALISLDRCFNDRFHYPIIIFHEPDARNHLRLITSWSKSYIVYQEITFKLPSFIPSSYRYENCTSHSRGYRHMCRFHSKLVYEQPIMRLLDYAWRLDDDSELPYPIEVDVFQFMYQNDIEYGYQVVIEDEARCVDGLWDAARQYVADNNLTTQFFHQLGDRRMFYNNFELSKMSFWLSKQYQHYINYIDQLGGIYYRRWGDAPTKSIGLSMFMPKRKIHNFTFVSYKHSWYLNPWNRNQAMPPWMVHNFFENL